ncbi:MAG: hypothetical protein Q8M31_19340 [Beijerinckiaceae bacterium]|nr:hypothetical protein [Beijerinckiaceae bacterium]
MKNLTPILQDYLHSQPTREQQDAQRAAARVDGLDEDDDLIEQ